VNKAMRVSTLSNLGGYRHISRGRYEFKYLLRPEVAERVVDFLASHLEMDEHCRGRDSNSYTVRSIYFDSPDFECFHEKLGGQKHREKFRIRTYNNPGSGPLFLENKIKDGLSYVKDKVTLNADILKAIKNLDYDSLSEVDRHDKDKRILDKFFFYTYRRAYSPVVLVVYDREAYVYPGQDTIRVTLDKNLRARMFPNLAQIYDEERLEYLLYHWIILEIKFTDILPRWMMPLNSLFYLKRQACSKYCTSVAHFIGGIPSFKDGLAYVRRI